LGQKIKGQGHNVCVDLQIEHNIAAVVYVSHAWFFSAVMPATQAMLVTPGFPRITSHVRLSLDAGFSPGWVFALL